MDKLWIMSFVVSTALLCSHRTNGDSEMNVELHTKKYVEKGSSVEIFCEHNVPPADLYKVTWLRNSGNKFFEYINGRMPPYRNFSIAGADIDFTRSNEKVVVLKNLDFEASGLYYCEVSTDSPIFTKASNEEQIHVILPQTSPPRISFKKRQFYVGEHLIANCTTSKARPAPHITWLINGKKVEEIHTRTLHPYGSSSGKNAHRSKSQYSSLSDKFEKNDKNDDNDVDARGGIKAQKEAEDGFEWNDAKHNNRNNHYHKSHTYDNFENLENNFNDRSNNFNNNFNYNRESNMDLYDNKNYDTHKKHRNNAFNKKYRRHANENQRVAGGTNEKGTERSNIHRAIHSSSQLNIEVSDLHAGINGRLEITCLATIPAHVGVGEQFADYKTYSVKIDIEAAEPTTEPPLVIGVPGALGNSSGKLNSINFTLKLLIQCLPIIMFLNFYQ